MIKSSTQLKDLLKNLSRKNSIEAQVLLQNYMMERFLERISLSEYRDMFILKGGMLVTSLVGLGSRTTFDIDTTTRGFSLDQETVKSVLADVIAVPIDDGVSFSIKNFSSIMDEAEYPGIRVHMVAMFERIWIPVKIDISTGDLVTPKEINYSYKLMLEDRTINVLAYALETVLAEKLETVVSRGISNTRMRDFYDIVALQMSDNDIRNEILREALHATAQKRDTEPKLQRAPSVFDDIEHSTDMQELWRRYQSKFEYASSITWTAAIDAVRKLYSRTTE